MKQEKESRKGLEQPIAKIEKETKAHKPTAPADDMGIVDKGQIVIGGLSDMDGDEVEKHVLARFDSPAMAMKMKIGHDKHYFFYFFFSSAPFSVSVCGCSDCFTGQSPGTRLARRAKVQGPGMLRQGGEATGGRRVRRGFR